MKLHFSYLNSQLTSFLTLLDNGPCHKNLPFSMRRAVLHSASLFVFPKSTGCQTALLPLSFAICGDLVYSREFLLKSFVPGDFLTFICFYAAEVKESHVVSRPPPRFITTLIGIMFFIKSGQTPRQLHFQQRSKPERKIKEL